MELLQHMAPLNGMKVLTQGPQNIHPRTRTPQQQRIQADWIADLKPGSVYIEHSNWLNFTHLNTPKPIMINLVRDPVERVISWFYYIRGSYKNALYYRKFPNAPVRPEAWFKKDFNQCVLSGDPECQYIPYTVKDFEGNHKRQSLFFCGHDDECLPFDSPNAIQIAKQNVERDYAVVGSWEDTNITFTVFENYIPRFFKGVKEVYEIFNEKVSNRNKNHRKPHIYDEVKAMIRKNFTNEFDFYYFCKQRLYKQYIALNLDKINSKLQFLNPKRMNNTKYADLEVLFFNRAAKVGSEALMELLQHMATDNAMTVLTEGPLAISTRTRTPKQQQIQADWIAELEPGTVYIEHCNWLNFTRLHSPKPIMINLVRDPVERLISWYYYVRGSYKNAIYYSRHPKAPIRSESWFKKDFNKCVLSGDPECQYIPNSVRDSEGNHKRQSLFFCGHDDVCLPFDSAKAIQIAKRNVELDYAVVGSWEDTNATLTVFERYIPRFFKGAKKTLEKYNNAVTNRNKNKRKPKIDDHVKALIRRNLTNEYDFYYFCKQRLYKQYLALAVDANFL